MIAAEWGTGEVFLSILWFFLFLMWMFLVIFIVFDIFRSHDLSGWAKALWVIGILVFPFLGILLYLVIRGGSMHERQVRAVEEQDAAMKEYIRDATSGPSAADELAKLADLHNAGKLSDEEFATAKARIIA